MQIRTFVIYLAGITKFEYERKNVKNSGPSGRIIPSRRAAKKYLSSRLIMNSRRLNLVQLAPRHRCLRAEASRDILKFRVLEMPFPRVFKRYFHCGHHVVSSEYIENTRKTGNNVVKMSQAFHDITQLKHFTDLNLFKYEFNVMIQNWQTDGL